MHRLAEETNAVLRTQSPAIFAMLSERGKQISFPKHGILGQTAQARGSRINATIGIGIEDDGTPMHLPSMQQMLSLDPKEVYPYAASYGKDELRKEWLRLLREKNPSYNGPLTLPVVTSGITHALSVAGFLFLDPGGTLLVPDVCWDNYALIFGNGLGAHVAQYPLFRCDGLDLEGLRAAVDAHRDTCVVLLNFPNNPSGYTPTEREALELSCLFLEASTRGQRIVVLLDDAYLGLVYEENVYRESLLSLLGALHENILVVKIDGATKEDYVWGHRVGFVTCACKGMTGEAAAALESKIAGVVRATVSNAPHLSQSLLLHLYRSPTYAAEKQEKFAILASRYRVVRDVLDSSQYDDCFTALPFNSGYFLCVQLKQGIDAERVRTTLLDEHGTGVIALGSVIRIAFSSVAEDKIPDLFKNIAAVCRSLSPSLHAKRLVARS